MRRRDWNPCAGPMGAAALVVAARVAGAAPATAPSEPPDVLAVRQQLMAYTREFAGAEVEKVRKAFHGSGGADCDRDARYVWRSEQAVAAVREHWGAPAAIRFAHLIGIDTIEDDATATVTVVGEHAAVTYPVATVRPDHLVRVDGQWLLDEAAYRADLAGDGLSLDAQYPTAAMQRVAEDVRADKYDDVDDLIDTVEDTLGVDPPGQPPTPPTPTPPSPRPSRRHRS